MMIRISRISYLPLNSPMLDFEIRELLYYLAKLLQLRSETKQVVIAENFENLYFDESMFHHPE